MKAYRPETYTTTQTTVDPLTGEVVTTRTTYGGEGMDNTGTGGGGMAGGSTGTGGTVPPETDGGQDIPTYPPGPVSDYTSQWKWIYSPNTTMPGVPANIGYLTDETINLTPQNWNLPVGIASNYSIIQFKRSVNFESTGTYKFTIKTNGRDTSLSYRVYVDGVGIAMRRPNSTLDTQEFYADIEAGYHKVDIHLVRYGISTLSNVFFFGKEVVTVQEPYVPPDTPPPPPKKEPYVPPDTPPPPPPPDGPTPNLPPDPPEEPDAPRPPDQAPTLPLPVQYKFVLTLVVGLLPNPVTELFRTLLDLSPSLREYEIGSKEEIEKLVINPIQVPLNNAMISDVSRLLRQKIDSYFDQNREFKTLLNFGIDYQPLMVNWKANSSTEGPGVVAKLYKPLPPDVQEGTKTYISRELIYPLVDKILVQRKPPEVKKIYLRPSNKNIKVTGQYGSSVSDVTMENLLSSGAFDEFRPHDSIVDEWYTTNLEGSELNIDYSNYSNFVFFGSAERRLEAFRNKLTMIEELDAKINYASASLGAIVSASGGTYSYSSSDAYAPMYQWSQQKQEVVRSLDGYERFLYYETGIPYSGSLVQDSELDSDDASYYIADATWPKMTGSLMPVSFYSSSVWYSQMQSVASEYDTWNANRFVNNLPGYIRDDAESGDFIKLFDLVGHIFDTVKPYIDKMPDIYQRNSEAMEGLSPDLVWDVAHSLGVSLPNHYAVKQILDYTLGVSSGSYVYRESAAEMWKRFLHNQIFLLKTKGTKTGLNTLLNVYGIPSTVIRIRESTTPSHFYTTSSFETYEENTNVLNFDGGQKVQIPWSGSVGKDTATLQVRFATTNTAAQTLVNGESYWGITLVPSASGVYQQVQVLSGSTAVLSSSFLEFSEGEYYNLQINYGVAGCTLYLKQADSDGDLTLDYEQTEASPNLSSVWYAPLTASLGGDGTYGAQFDGYVDEFRVWSEIPTEQNVDFWTKYPGMYNGNTPTSTRDYLLVRLSFNKAQNLFSDPLLPNESPYIRTSTAPAAYLYLTSVGFTNSTTYPYSMVYNTRTVQRMAPTAGGLVFDTNKIKIADENEIVYLSGSTIPVLRRDRSIRSMKDASEKNVAANNVIGFYFSTTEAVNDSIIRSIGNIDIHDYIGDVMNLKSSSYKDLDDLNSLYWSTYSYGISQNSFIDYVKSTMTHIFEQAEKFIPARSKLLTGIVVEPHMLERYRYGIKPIINEDEAILNLQASVMTTQPDVVSAERPEYEDTVNVNSIQYFVGERTDHESTLELENIYQFEGERQNYEDVIEVSEELFDLLGLYTDYTSIIELEESILSLYPTYADYETTIDIGELLLNATTRFKTQILFEDDYFMPTYGSDTIDPLQPDSTKNLAATVYFTHPLGYIGIKGYTYRRKNSSILTDKGTWIQGTNYKKYDVVTQPTTITDSRYVNGNNKEFYAVQDNFVSNLPPQGDRFHWRRVAYEPILQKVVKKAVLISGSLSLVDTTSALPPVTGYLPQHYRFFRPVETGFKRSRYLGVVQTKDTTIDGKDPVEIFASQQDELFVRDTGDPILKTFPTTGPILDVE